jgi:hypothetical protein
MQTYAERARSPMLGADLTPYNWLDPIEGDLQSPARHLRDLTCPLALYCGQAEEPTVVAQTKAMQASAVKLGKTVTIEVIPAADHLTALAPAMQKSMAWFQSFSAAPGL